MKKKLVTDGVKIREFKQPNDLFLNLFKGKLVAKCTNEEIANKFVELYNKNLESA